MSQATLEKLYAAFAKADTDAMAECYADEVAFDDPAFSLRGKHEVVGMWSMLCANIRARDFKDWELRAGPFTASTAHWEPIYRFGGAQGRMVHNVIDSRFEFNSQGLITRQWDHFDFWAWSRQALGPAGLLLGWSPLLRNKVRRTARHNLDRFLAKA
ncbi:hypothetical protein HNQ51_002861 [Inhella inkyongensis]|uniref:SnoaL-like domain-containing protein n=1 Tax=Inhella inkyongensis TaxID=392593 RepID=A0A840S7G0_9BURK|nr:nuclear transport factor 2 family protein [Inhella inkyongensis]MBB5205542.1 hypothetical protein [Inhella inkyongensis]